MTNYNRSTPPGNTAQGRRCNTCGRIATLYYHNGKSQCQDCIVEHAEKLIEKHSPNPGTSRHEYGGIAQDLPLAARTRTPTLKESKEGYVVTSMDMDFLFTQVKEMKNALDKLARQITGINLSHGDLAREVHENTEVLKDLIEELSE